MSLAAVLAALSDPVRLEIVCMLASGPERSCGSLGLPIAKSTLAHHLKVLREAGVIVQRPVGTSRMMCLRRKDLDARFPGLLDSVLTAARKRRSRHYANRRPLLWPGRTEKAERSTCRSRLA